MSTEKSWFTTLPGVLTGLAAVVSAITGLVIALNGSPKENDTSHNAEPVTTEETLTEEVGNNQPMEEVIEEEIIEEELPEPLYSGDMIQISDQEGRYLGYFYEGNNHNYPTLLDKAHATSFKITNEAGGELKDHGKVEIQSRETALKHMSYLGFFSDDTYVYYSVPEHAGSTWRIEIQEQNALLLRNEDHVQIVYVYNGGYLAPKYYDGDGKYYLTVSEKPYDWIVSRL